MDSIPIIDVGRDPSIVGIELDDVCRMVGFFQIVNHSVPDAVADQAWKAARAFFDLPLQDRMSVVRPDPGYPYGYSPMSVETLSLSLGNAGAADLKESFTIGPVKPLGRPYIDEQEAAAHSPNLWPSALPEMKKAWESYYQELRCLATRLMRLFAIGLNLPTEYFDKDIDESPSALRALNYPAQENVPAPGQLRAGAHTDYGTLTILRQDDAPGGLEVQSPHDGRWVPVPSVAGAFVVNIGDLMARWTNDRWRSTMHRVVNPGAGVRLASRRQSMPFFHSANYHCRVECLPSCLAPGERPKYEPVLAGPHLIGKFKKTTGAVAA